MSDEIKKGLLGIVVDETEVSKVMPEINSLTHRGYAAQDLCEYCRFEEVAYLILNKDLPNSIELKKFEKEERGNRELSKNLYEIKTTWCTYLFYRELKVLKQNNLLHVIN